jgi:short-subunit dehydrogenase
MGGVNFNSRRGRVGIRHSPPRSSRRQGTGHVFPFPGSSAIEKCAKARNAAAARPVFYCVPGRLLYGGGRRRVKLLAGQTVLLTGASGGLGAFMALALAGRRLKLALAAHPGVDLEKLRQSAEQHGCETVAYCCDLREPVQRRELLRRVERDLGPIDVLINNAGVEFTAFYHELTEENICEVLKVNLEAPMVLSRLVLPGMLERKRGHIVNISSLAGKAGPAFQEPYAATKAGLVAFTQSLRATYRGTGVGASAVVPGFVEAGIYADLKQRSGCAAPALLGTSRPETVARTVIRVIERDIPEVIVNPIPMRPLLAFTALFPRLGAWVGEKAGANDFFRRVVEAQRSRGNAD